MQHYLDHNLQKDEEIILSPRLHWSVYVNIFFMFLLMFVLFCLMMNDIKFNIEIFPDFFRYVEVFVGFVIAMRVIYLWVRCASVEMMVTNYRVVLKRGIWNIHTEELENKRIESVEVRQPLMGYIFNYGNICFSGTGTSKLVFKRVFAPWDVKSRIEEIMRGISV